MAKKTDQPAFKDTDAAARPRRRRKPDSSPDVLTKDKIASASSQTGLQHDAKGKTTHQQPQQAPSHDKQPALNRQQIAVAALTLIDQHGLDAFSLRNLGNALGVSAAALYWHVPNRNAVLAEVIALVVGGVTPSPDLAWQDYLRELIWRFRTALRRHPNTAPLLGAEIVANSATDLGLVEGLLRALTAAGFKGDCIVNAYNATCAAMIGFAMEELCPMPEDAGAWQTTVQDRLAQVSVADYPNLAEHLPRLANRSFMLRWQSGISMPMDDSFSFFVEVFLQGLALKAAEQQAHHIERPLRRRKMSGSVK